MTKASNIGRSKAMALEVRFFRATLGLGPSSRPRSTPSRWTPGGEWVLGTETKEDMNFVSSETNIMKLNLIIDLLTEELNSVSDAMKVSHDSAFRGHTGHFVDLWWRFCLSQAEGNKTRPGSLAVNLRASLVLLHLAVKIDEPSELSNLEMFLFGFSTTFGFGPQHVGSPWVATAAPDVSNPHLWVFLLWQIVSQNLLDHDQNKTRNWFWQKTSDIYMVLIHHGINIYVNCHEFRCVLFWLHPTQLSAGTSSAATPTPKT